MQRPNPVTGYVVSTGSARRLSPVWAISAPPQEPPVTSDAAGARQKGLSIRPAVPVYCHCTPRRGGALLSVRGYDEEGASSLAARRFAA
jgi:hypothetical protein